MPHSREEMLERARQAIDRAEVYTQDYQGSCRTCTYFSAKDSYTCVHPIVVTASLLVDQGYRRDVVQSADYQRKDGDGAWGQVLCGPNGALYEPKKSWWDTIKSWFENREME